MVPSVRAVVSVVAPVVAVSVASTLLSTSPTVMGLPLPSSEFGIGRVAGSLSSTSSVVLVNTSLGWPSTVPSMAPSARSPASSASTVLVSPAACWLIS